jgi:hypothetical protein
VIGDHSKRLDEASSYTEDIYRPCWPVNDSLYALATRTQLETSDTYESHPKDSTPPTPSLPPPTSSPKGCSRRSYYRCHQRDRLHHTITTTSTTTTIATTSTCSRPPPPTTMLHSPRPPPLNMPLLPPPLHTVISNNVGSAACVGATAMSKLGRIMTV